jgi:uncharacterized membrane protein YciS (DUF1049 family)
MRDNGGDSFFAIFIPGFCIGWLVCSLFGLGKHSVSRAPTQELREELNKREKLEMRKGK